MTSFSLQDVRETFENDMRRLLREVEVRASELDEARALADRLLDTALPDSFDLLAQHCHTIFGTAALVGVDSISQVAERVQQIAEEGQVAVLAARAKMAHVVRLSELCREVAAELPEILGQELQGGSEAASERSRVVLARLAGESVESELAPDAPSVEGRLVADRLDGELRRALDEELSASALRLKGLCASEPSPEVFEELGVLLHTLAGALGAVGLSAGAERARALSTECADRPPERGESLRADIAEIYALAGRPDLAQTFWRTDPELAGALADELADAERELSSLFAILAPARRDVIEEVRRVHHRLKGALAAVGLERGRILAEALQLELEQWLEPGGAPPRAAVEDLVRRSSALLRESALLLQSSHSSVARPGADPSSVRSRGGDALSLESRARESLDRELAAARAEVARVGRTLELQPDTVQPALSRLFHRLRGSALLVGDARLASAAESLQSMVDDGAADPAQVRAALEAWVAGGAASAPRRAAASSARVAADQVAGGSSERISLPDDPELREAFLAETRDIMSNLDAAVERLHTGDGGEEVLSGLLREYHTLKGVMLTIGLTGMGEELHAVEEALEHALAKPGQVAVASLADALRWVQDEVRRVLEQVPTGTVTTRPAQLAARLAALDDSAAGPGASQSGSGRGPVAPTATRPARASSTQTAAEGGLGLRQIRVPAESLDRMMTLAGELVVGRSRFDARVRRLLDLGRVISDGRRRLVGTIEDLRRDFEFTLQSEQGGRQARAAEGPTDLGRFGELELDSYDQLNILSRRIVELVDDSSEVDAQVLTELGSLSDDTELLARNVRDLQHEVTRASLVPLELLFSRLRLPIREAASQEQKAVRVEIAGAEVLLDRTIVDALFQPMLHLVRNAVAHGIEPTAARISQGKTAEGLISLRASQEGGQILLEVVDDGAGLDLERLRARGVALGLVEPDVRLEAPEVRELVFAPGLSTRAAAGLTSGRGVGCDFVRRAVQRMNGTIAVESHRSVGTRFAISLPLTLAITRAMVVESGGGRYAVPVSMVERVLPHDGSATVSSNGRKWLKHGEGLVPAHGLDEALGEVSAGRQEGVALLLRLGDRSAGLLVDRVVGQEEIFVKGLGDLLQGHPYFAAVTIRADGELAPVLDVAGILELRGAHTPLRRAAAAEAAAPLPAQARKRLRVLFADDSISVRKVAERTLLGLGVEVVLAVDGVEALERMRGERFDLVFTDLEMPRMNGYDLLRQLRFLPAFADVPVVVVSSRSAQKHRDAAVELGARAYLTKPFSSESLLAVLRAHAGYLAEGPDPLVRVKAGAR